MVSVGMLALSVDDGRGAGRVVAEAEEPVQRVVLLVHVVQVVGGGVGAEYDWRELGRLLRHSEVEFFG